MSRALLSLLLALFVTAAVRAAEPAFSAIRFHTATPAPELDALFRQTDGWIGGDGGYTVSLPGAKLVWLFGDTWVGEIRNGRRINADIVNNSIAVQDVSDLTAQPRFVVKKTATGAPAAWLRPKDEATWLWIFGSTRVGEKVYLLVTHVGKTGDGAFGFQPKGQYLGVVENAHDDPADWRIDLRPLPFTRYTAKDERTFGVCAFEDKDFFYVYGTDEDVTKNPRRRDLIVARAPADKVEDFSAWRFWDGKEWQAKPERAARVVENGGSEASVNWLAGIDRYVLLYTRGGMSADILARTAPNPWGPWSDATTIYKCPEMDLKAGVFTYAAKAQPALAKSDDELVINYYANALTLEQVAADPGIYVPKFVRVKVSKE